MNYDIQLGYKSFNLEAVRAALVVDKPVSQSDLNKIEWVMQYDTMPPTRYTALHWAGKVSDTERAEIPAGLRNSASSITPVTIPPRSIVTSLCSRYRKAFRPMPVKWRWALRFTTTRVFPVTARFLARTAMP